uniref:Uncharacterized protein n=1 Tax=viral metagenome TaxID=1070528 RepID=A0A6M3J457_9ZZZZ
MGGCTVTRRGKTVEDVLEQLKKEILAGYGLYNLEPDGDVALIKAEKEAGVITTSKIFKPTICWKGDVKEGAELIDRIALPVDVTFEEIEKGNVGRALSVASRFAEPPKLDEWVGCVHLHT